MSSPFLKKVYFFANFLFCTHIISILGQKLWEIKNTAYILFKSNKKAILGIFLPSIAKNQNKLRMGTRIKGINTDGVILAVLTFVAPRKLSPIRTRMSEPVPER